MPLCFCAQMKDWKFGYAKAGVSTSWRCQGLFCPLISKRCFKIMQLKTHSLNFKAALITFLQFWKVASSLRLDAIFHKIIYYNNILRSVTAHIVRTLFKSTLGAEEWIVPFLSWRGMMFNSILWKIALLLQKVIGYRSKNSHPAPLGCNSVR